MSTITSIHFIPAAHNSRTPFVHQNPHTRKILAVQICSSCFPGLIWPSNWSSFKAASAAAVGWVMMPTILLGILEQQQCFSTRAPRQQAKWIYLFRTCYVENRAAGPHQQRQQTAKGSMRACPAGERIEGRGMRYAFFFDSTKRNMGMFHETR